MDTHSALLIILATQAFQAIETSQIRGGLVNSPANTLEQVDIHFESPHFSHFTG